MVAVSYEPLIRDMTWSYSRIKSFADCKHKWYLRYILLQNRKGKELFFASYGIFMHELIASHNSGEKPAQQLKLEYINGFRSKVKAPAPSRKVFENYFTDGLNYFNSLSPSGNEKLMIEIKAEFKIDSIPFVGYIDLVERDNSGDILLIDNKSKALKPRSTGNKARKSDEELDEYLRQLYLYSYYIFAQYGRFPDKLCFNCFRKDLFIEEPFDKTAYERAIGWFLNKIEEIAVETEFNPDIDFFRCRYLCEMQDHCEYFKLNWG